jgi:hypothetical protein
MKKTKHPEPDVAETQCELILARLEKARGRWVMMPELSRVSGSYVVHSRIADLRAQGHPIPRPKLWRVGRHMCSAYRIEV